MAITNFGELKTAIANWLERDTLTDRIPEFVALAEDRIAQDQKLRIRAMEVSANITIDGMEVDLDTNAPGYVAARRLYLDDSPRRRLEFLPPEDFWIRFLSIQNGRPKFFTVEGENIVFGPSPDITYNGKFLYYQRFPALSDDTDTNWILANARGLLLYGSLVEASPFIKDDPRISLWAALFDEAVDAVHKANKRDRYEAGAPLMVQTDVTTDPGTARTL